MKATKAIFTILLVFFSTCIYSQLKVLSNGVIKNYNQTAIYSNTNNVNDVLDILGDNPSLSNGVDLIWGMFRVPQPNNPGLLTLMSVDGGYFTVRSNGCVGIYNNHPSCALEIGTVGTNYEMKINGSLVLTSDERVKENIKNIDDKSLSKLKQLKGVNYNFKNTNKESKQSLYMDTVGDFEKPKFNPSMNNSSYKRCYYGFLAQDVQELFPDLVYKDSAGMLGIDYIGIIPLLVNAINEQEITITTQNEKISDLETRLTILENNNNSSIQKVVANKTSDELEILSYPILDQNIPNPFNSVSIIGFYLPNTVNIASIYIYDMNGLQLKNYSVKERGRSNITIEGSELNAGMYLYALIADGKVIDTKRMILTK